jgi:hypothetical protein
VPGDTAITAAGGLCAPVGAYSTLLGRQHWLQDMLTDALVHPKLGPPGPELCDTPLWMLDDEDITQCENEPVAEIGDTMYGEVCTRRVCRVHALRYWRAEVASAQAGLAAVEASAG